MRRLAALLLAAGLACALWTLSEAVRAQKPERSVEVKKTFGAQGVDRVTADVQVGSTEVYTDSPGEIRITAVRKAKGGSEEMARRWLTESKVEIEKQGGAVVLKDIVPKELQRTHSGRPEVHLDVEIHMPPKLALEVSGGVGHVKATGTFGDVSLHSGVGDVALEGQVGNLHVKSGVGKINLKRLRCSGGGFDAHTGVGDIVMELEEVAARRMRVDAGVGSVKVSLPPRIKASVVMSTGVGGLKSAYPLASPRRGIGQVGGRMLGDLNGGGTPIEIKVGTGDIRLDKSLSR